MHHEPLILFDGVCNLCSASVRYVIRRDPNKLFRFASLQSPLGLRLTEQSNCPGLNSMLLLTNGVLYQKSTAALKILRMIGGFPALMYAFIIFPAPIRDWVYDFVGKRRYRWFGKNEQCWIPDQDISDRFVDDDN
jgi:predicted DCC family thiol-disulfide oxidoreductase YuxK